LNARKFERHPERIRTAIIFTVQSESSCRPQLFFLRHLLFSQAVKEQVCLCWGANLGTHLGAEEGAEHEA
jgi:hypothetical protein